MISVLIDWPADPGSVKLSYWAVNGLLMGRIYTITCYKCICRLATSVPHAN